LPFAERVDTARAGPETTSIDEREDLEWSREALEVLRTARLEAETTILDEASGAGRDHDLRCSADSHHPRGRMDRHTADVSRKELHLAGVDADPDGQAHLIGGVTDRCCAPDRSLCAGKHRQEAVAGRVHLLAEVALQAGSNHAIVLAKLLLPGRIPKSARRRGRVDDVGHQERRHDPVLARRSPKLLDVAEEVEDDGGLIADDPGIVAGWDIEDLVRPDLDVLAIVHLDRDSARQQVLKMVDLAERLVGLLAQVLGPSEARLDGRISERQGPDAKQVQGDRGQLANLVGFMDALVLDAAHKARVGARDRTVK
jgi:hypothetical protein